MAKGLAGVIAFGVAVAVGTLGVIAEVDVADRVGLPVAVGVKAGEDVGRLFGPVVGIDVETRAAGREVPPILASRQACKKASRPR